MSAAATEPASRLDVPFVDVGALHASLKQRILDELAAVIDSSAFSNGPAVAAFEQAFAAYCHRPCCVGVASGLDALRVGLLAAGLEPGDEVIVPANTFVATLEAVEQAGGRPVVVDVSEADYNMDVAAASDAIGPRTRCLLPVHLFGQLADVTTLERLARTRGLMLIEDACQAHGATRDGRHAGAVGIVGGFSFYPSKNLGAMGDAGALVTPDADVAARARALREHGQTAKYRHDVPGYTSRLDTVQAVVLGLKLPHLAGWNDARRAAAAYYSEALKEVGDLRTMPVPPGSDPVWHLYVVRTSDPAALGSFLSERGIQSGRHYPVPVHLTRAYAHLGLGRGDFPVAELLADELLSLPLFPGISEAQLEAVVTAVSEYFAGR